jgi:hypothetical protein
MVPKTTLSNYIWSELKNRVVDLLIVPMYMIFKGHVIAKLNRISALNNNILNVTVHRNILCNICTYYLIRK